MSILALGWIGGVIPAVADAPTVEFFTVDGTSVYFAELNLSKPRVLVSGRGDERYFVVPLSPDDTSGLGLATVAWLGDPAHLAEVATVTDNAETEAETSEEALELGEVVFVNKDIDAWLQSNGAAQEIEALTSSVDLDTKCKDIPICDSCQAFICGWFFGYYYCSCRLIGQTCCVINP